MSVRVEPTGGNKVEVKTPFRIAVFTGDLSGHVTATLRAILEDNPDAELLVLHHSPTRSIRKLLWNQIRNTKKHGWRWLPYQGRELVRTRIAQSRRSRTVKPQADIGTHPNVTVDTVPSVNAHEVVDRLREWRPDLGLSIAAPILREPLFSLPSLGTLNIHKGRLPQYRGMPPAFWELWSREQSVGITVHRVEKGLDTGPILLSDAIPVEQYSTPAGLRVRLDALGIALMRHAVREIRAGNPVYRPQIGQGRTFTRPTLAQERALARRLDPPKVRRALKKSVLTAYTLAARLRQGSEPRIVVLLYHRVSDQLRDAVTVGVEQFDTHVRFLSDHYELARLDDIVSGATRVGTDPIVAISFDDGYLDNYENAAPVLERHGVPATFFVSTGHITNNLPFEHDLRKLGRGLPNMTWDQIREMQREGFSFGSHTANHVNLAEIDCSMAREELSQSKLALTRELGLDRVMFAYPFGKRGDITPERLELVKRAGYVCNCSAGGGVNRLPLDPWDIRRQGVNYEFDLPALAARIAGWKEWVLI